MNTEILSSIQAVERAPYVYKKSNYVINPT